MKRVGRIRIRTILFLLSFLFGLGMLMYPLVANLWNEQRQQKLITTYQEAVSEISASGGLEEEWARAYAYNNALLPMVLPDSFAEAEERTEEDEEYISCLNINGDGVMGYISIPKIDISIPIYHTTDDDVLQKGAGHLEGSSLPVGGESTHAVIAAHRGLANASMFTDLDLLEIGDHFLIYVLDDVLCYEVDQILIVEPEDTSALDVVDGEDYVTLLTCTPYGVNTMRLLVRGHRVDYVEKEVAAEEGTAQLSVHTSYWMWVALGLLVTALVILLLILLERRRRRRKAQKA